MLRYLFLYLFSCIVVIFLLTGYFFEGFSLSKISLRGFTFSPPPGEWFLAHTLHSGTTEWNVFYHEIGPAADNAREADILLLGNSRALFAFDQDVLRKFSEHYGIKIFNLSFPGEGDVWSLQLFEKLNLRPKLVIIAAESGGGDSTNAPFFENICRGACHLTPDRMEAIKLFVGKTISWRFLMLRHDFCPWWLEKILPPYPEKWNHRYSYRSSKDGAWFRDGFENEPTPVYPCGIKGTPAPAEFEHTKKFIAEMRKREIKVFFASIPFSWACYNCTQVLADSVNVPFLMVGYNQLEIRDGAAGHLTTKSAKIFTESLLKQLEKQADFIKLFVNNNNNLSSPLNKEDYWNENKDKLITVLSATYGKNVGCVSGNTLLSMKAACDGRATCNFVIDVESLGDCAPGMAKDFIAQWQCFPNTKVYSASMPPGVGFKEIIDLSCKNR